MLAALTCHADSPLLATHPAHYSWPRSTPLCGSENTERTRDIEAFHTVAAQSASVICEGILSEERTPSSSVCLPVVSRSRCVPSSRPAPSAASPIDPSSRGVVRTTLLRSASTCSPSPPPFAGIPSSFPTPFSAASAHAVCAPPPA